MNEPRSLLRCSAGILVSVCFAAAGPASSAALAPPPATAQAAAAVPDAKAAPQPSAPANATPSDDEVRAILRERVEVGASSGIVVGVFDGGASRIVAFGKAKDGEGAAAPDGDTVFEIGSITKVFTAAILADMAARNEVRLDDPIAKYLPEGVHAPSKDGKEITFLDLATHRSGLPRMPSNFEPKDPENPYADYSLEKMFAFLSA